MKKETINLYGDLRITTVSGNGVDVSAQRADKLDLMAVDYIRVIAKKRAVFALDVGCGHGGQAARMAKAGARVTAMDIHDYRVEIARTLANEGVHSGQCFFIRADVESEQDVGPVEVVVCQRTIHYLDHQAAEKALAWLHHISVSGGRMFLSASGLDSELGNGYPAQDLPVERRFAHLSPEMAEKHAIFLPVCLYRPDELADLATQAGWGVEEVFTSPFGNIKLVALKTCSS